MTLADKVKDVKVADYLNPFQVFEPLQACRRRDVFISTWGLADPLRMEPVVEWLSRANSICLLVGYSKTTHNLADLLEVCRLYAALNWKVRALPSFHTKLWIVDHKAWVGSCNFCPSTIVNHMWAVPFKRVQPIPMCYWSQASAISKSTDLALIPQAKKHA